MSSIKKHQCPSCGANLSVDNEKQMYYCKSCGSTYDYEYFREEEMHEMGETYLLRGEYMAATDAYRFILKKDPHEYRALKGLMFAAAHLKNLNEVIHAETKGFSYDKELVREAVEGGTEETEKIFVRWEQIYADMKSVSDRKAEIESLRKEQSRIDESIDANKQMRSEFIPEEDPLSSPLVYFAFYWILSGIFFLFSLFLFVLSGGFSIFKSIPSLVVVLFFALVGVTVVVINMVKVYPKVKLIKKYERSVGQLYVESGRIEDKIKNLNAEIEKLSAGISKSCFDLLQEDKKIMRDMKTS